MKSEKLILLVLLIFLINSIVGIFLLRKNQRLWEWILSSPNLFLSILSTQLWFIIYLIYFLLPFFTKIEEKTNVKQIENIETKEDFLELENLFNNFPENCVGKRIFYQKKEVGLIYFFDGVKYYIATKEPNYVSIISNLFKEQGLNDFVVFFVTYKNILDSSNKLLK